MALSSTSAAAAGVAFAPVQTYAVGAQPTQIVAGHLNRDSILDLATVNDNAVAGHQVSVLLSTGGSYSVVDIANTDNAKSIATGDIDGDGIDDLVVANHSSANGVHGVSVFLNDGNGGFAPARFLDLTNGSSPWGVAISNTLGSASRPHAGGSLNVSTADVIVTADAAGGAGSTTTVFVNDGLGTLTERPALPSYSDGRQIVPVDLNGDFKIDLLEASGADPGGAHSLVNAGAAFTAFATLGLAGVTGVESIAAGDLTGDLSADVVVPSAAEDTVYIAPNDHSGAFDPLAATAVPVGDAPTGAAVSDLDRNSVNDLVVANSGSSDLSLRLGTTPGTLAVAPSLRTSAPGGGPHSVVAADLNGDGYPDLASADTGSNQVSVWIAVPPRVDFAPAALDFGAQPLGSTTSRTVLVTNEGPQTLLVPLPARVGGRDASAFSVQSSTCLGALAAGALCGVTIGFTPSRAGATIAALDLGTSGRGAPSPYVLAGTGAAAVTTPAVLPSQVVAGVRAVTAKRCVVPKLVNKTLRQAKKLLGKARCKLGKVRKARVSKQASAKLRARLRTKRYRASTVIYRQSPKARKRLKVGSRVTVTTRTRIRRVSKR